MNINCIICSDILTPKEEVYTTPCGHLFHQVCLLQWIMRSKTCPQCRNKTTETSIQRIYFNFADTENVVDNVVILQSQLDNLRGKLSLKENCIKSYKDKYEREEANNTGLRAHIKELEEKSRVVQSEMHGLKEQISYFKQKGKERNRLGEEVIRLKEKIKDLENVKVILNGSKDEVKNMLRHNRDPQSLSTLVSILKKTLVETDRKYKQISSDLKHTQNNVSFCRKQIMEIEQENAKLMQDIESHKHCAMERHHLKRKISDLETKTLSHESNISKIRILDHSTSMLNDDSRHSLNKTFTIDDRVQQIQESDSPYLPIKSSNIGLSHLLKSKYTTSKQPSSQKEPRKFNMLAQSQTDLKLPSKEYSYNGLGGHSKQDHFPSPKSISSLKKVKTKKMKN